MKRPSAKKATKPTIDELELLRSEDFKWLAEIHNVLSPYWSARSGYQAGRTPVRA